MKIDSEGNIVLNCPVCGMEVCSSVESIKFTMAKYSLRRYETENKQVYWMICNLTECKNCHTTFGGDLIVPLDRIEWSVKNESRVD